MSYFDKKKGFNALKQDLENMNAKSAKNSEANSAFGGGELGDPTKSEPVVVEVEKVVEKVPKIKIDLIEGRSKNEFASIKVSTLKASILSTRLMDPISVCDNGDGKYTIISGHRRKKAFDEIIKELNVEKAGLEKEDPKVKEVQEQINFYSEIPAIVYEIVPDNSKLLGTDSRYITQKQEEEMYRAGNLESRQLSQEELIKHIIYFYNLINSDKKLYDSLLEERNKNAQRKATKLNIPETLKTLLIDELKFKANPTHIWRVVTILDDKELTHAKYKEKALERISDGKEAVKPVFTDFQLYTKICDDGDGSKKDYRKRILAQIEDGKPAEPLYNQYFEIEEKKKTLKEVVVKIDKNEVMKLLKDVQNGMIGIDTAIKRIKEMS